MRGALQIDGIAMVDVAPGRRDFTVVYDPAKVDVATVLSLLRKKGEPAQVVGG